MRQFFKKIISSKMILSYRYRRIFGRWPDFNNGKTFNEKIITRMIKSNYTFSLLSDKLAVRDYVQNKIGSEFLIPIYWSGLQLNYDEVSKLATPFILKANHGSGTNKVVFSFSENDFFELKKIADTWLNTDFSLINLEKHYKNINRKLFIEKLLITEDGDIPSDYKVHCFNRSKKYFIQVDYDRFQPEGREHTRNIYDEEWTKLDLMIAYENNPKLHEKPLLLNQILDFSKKLSEEFDYVRVDWYILNDRLYFGEMTFTHGAGTEIFIPQDMDYKWGEYW